MTNGREEKRGGEIAAGAAFVLIGTAFLLNNFNLFHVPHVNWWRLGAVILGGLGVLKLVRPTKEDDRRGGVWMITIAALLALHQTRVLSFSESWPIFIVIFGVSLVWKALAPPGPGESVSDDGR